MYKATLKLFIACFMVISFAGCKKTTKVKKPQKPYKSFLQYKDAIDENEKDIAKF